MGWVLMSERDVRRIEVLTEILSGRRTVASAAIVLAISVRQVHRKARMRIRETDTRLAPASCSGIRR
jgi:hypothetical protein